MKVVSNTSPLSYSIFLGQSDHLAQLFGTMHVPAAVMLELLHPRAPADVRRWAEKPPDWIVVESDPSPSAQDQADDPHLRRLHAGERAAILLAQRLHADLLLLDERAARAVAGSKGIQVAGLLAVMRLAAERGLVDFPQAVQDLRALGFRMSSELLKRMR